jgi:ABC-type antimicrobial peptide transport system permease subunit
MDWRLFHGFMLWVNGIIVLLVVSTLLSPGGTMLPLRTAPEPMSTKAIVLMVGYVVGNLFVALRASKRDY